MTALFLRRERPFCRTGTVSGKHCRRAGFTLIEIVMVLVILGIIAAFAAGKYFDLHGSASEKVCANNRALVARTMAVEYASYRVRGVTAPDAAAMIDEVLSALSKGACTNGGSCPALCPAQQWGGTFTIAQTDPQDNPSVFSVTCSEHGESSGSDSGASAKTQIEQTLSSTGYLTESELLAKLASGATVTAGDVNNAMSQGYLVYSENAGAFYLIPSGTALTSANTSGGLGKSVAGNGAIQVSRIDTSEGNTYRFEGGQYYNSAGESVSSVPAGAVVLLDGSAYVSTWEQSGAVVQPTHGMGWLKVNNAASVIK